MKIVYLKHQRIHNDQKSKENNLHLTKKGKFGTQKITAKLYLEEKKCLKMYSND